MNARIRHGGTMRNLPRIARVLLGGAAALLAMLSLFPSRAMSQEPSLRGDPFRGRVIFGDKLCTRCHSVWGHGGILAPDMATAVSGKTWLDLVGDFWNHTPRMIDAMSEQGHAWPTLEPDEMSDLLSYLYYLRLFDEPGDAARGGLVYAQMRCADCHSLGDRGASLGGPLDGYSTYPSSLVLAQEMWNAGPAMQEAQIGRGTPIPRFRRNDMADIQAYLRDEGVRTDREVKLLPLLDPARGATVFRQKRCDSCHRGAQGEGPDLAESARDKTFSEISGILWNHSYAMHDRMRSRGIPFPRFEDTELGDVIAYLYFRSFLGERGDADTGAMIFRDKGCATCHESHGTLAPDLAMEPAADSMLLSAAMWNHAPGMHELMAERSVAWPKFDPGDMDDLVAYLRRISTRGDDEE